MKPGANQMTEELFPCPFCGVEPTVKKSKIKGVDDTVNCSNQYCSFFGTMRISEWNKRPSNKAEKLANCLEVAVLALQKLGCKESELKHYKQVLKEYRKGN